MKVALLSFNKDSGKWESTCGGRVVSWSKDKQFVKYQSLHSDRARKMGIERVEEVGGPSENNSANESDVDLVEFSVPERFQFLKDTVDMVASRDMKSTIVVGNAGLGKTFTVHSQLQNNGMVDVTSISSEADSETDEYVECREISASAMRLEYVNLKGFTTPKALYRVLYNNRHRIIVLDDIDSALNNPTSANILKAALDSTGKRVVTWNSESFGESDLPKSFEFKGGIIFITNMSMDSIPQALLSRSACIDVTLNREEIVARMRDIVSAGEFLKNEDMDLKLEALDFIERNIHNTRIKTINLRSLIMVVTNLRCKPDNWEKLSLSMLMAAR